MTGSSFAVPGDGKGRTRARRWCCAIIASLPFVIGACGTKTFYSRAKPTSRDIGCSDTNEQPIAVVQGITSGEYGWVCGRPPSCRGGQEVVWARTGATRDYDSANQYVVEGKCVPKCGDGEERAPSGDCLATRSARSGGALTCAEMSNCFERRCPEQSACAKRCLNWQLACVESVATQPAELQLAEECRSRGKQCSADCGGGACFQRCFQLQAACRDQATIRGE